MNRFSRLLALLMSLCLMVSLLASCGGNTDSGGSTADAGKDTFTVALDSDIVKLDPPMTLPPTPWSTRSPRAC
mgnify:CR=1 FL=1